ncbi:MAG: dephospho-CoA kinase [Spirochaetes bacterium]|nr:dephospho-CoA kinase [Spirochaetota bacterium]
MVIGIAGKYCSGKDVIADFIREYGFMVIDVDAIGHTVLEREKEKIISAFGMSVVDETGTVNRMKLGEIVFGNRRNKAVLESILHPVMVKEVKEIISRSDGNIVINAAILFHMGLHQLCDFVICVKAPFTIRLIRALKRDKLPIFHALKRLFDQRRICPKSGRYQVDIYNVRNSGNIAAAGKKIKRILYSKGIVKG